MAGGSMDRPELDGQGGNAFHGWVTAGQWGLEVWTYAGRWRAPVTGTTKPFVGDDQVIVLGDGRMDLVFGAIPYVKAPDPQLIPYLPPRVSGRGMDLTLNA